MTPHKAVFQSYKLCEIKHLTFALQERGYESIKVLHRPAIFRKFKQKYLTLLTTNKQVKFCYNTLLPLDAYCI